MTLNPAPILPALQQQFWDKTLNVPLSGGFVNFYEDEARSVPKVVYELVGSGPGSYSYVSLGSQLQLSGLGTFIDSSGGAILIYLWPYLGTPNDATPSQTVQNYYITVYSSTGVFQEDYSNIPGLPVSGGSGNGSSTSDNIISNGQFVDVDFPSTATSSSPQSFTLAANGVTEIAPDWSIVTTGAGTVNVWQVPVADSGAPGNPAYALGISTTGFSAPVQLRQRILAPRILSNTPVSATFIAECTTVATVSMTYTPSITNISQTICTGNATSAGFTVVGNVSPVNITNPGNGTGFVDVAIVFPAGVSMLFSCVQLCAAINNEIVNYIQETPEREIDHLFHYFQPAINFKPINSLLVGWDFALNPMQFGVTTFTNSPQYVWDQTICCSVVGTVNVAQSASGGFQFSTTNASEAVYMLQYLSSKQAVLTALSRLSVNLNAFASTSDVVARVYLFYGNLSSTIPLLSTPATIGTVNADGTFNLTAGPTWQPIAQGLAFSNKVTLGTGSKDFGFSSWDNTANSSTTANFAIVVTFSCPTSSTNVVVQSTSCVPGDIPTRPAPLTLDQTQRLCWYYYEDSRTISANLYNMDSQAIPGATTVQVFPSGFTVNYQTIKRALPNLTNNNFVAYSAVNAANNVTVFLFYANNAGVITHINPDVQFLGAGGNWTLKTNALDGISFEPNEGGAAYTIAQVSGGTVSGSSFFVTGQIGLGYVVDVRLGIV